MKLLKLILLSISASLCLVTTAQASTFVGNGGNAGDIELQVALNQIQQTLNLLVKNANAADVKLCTCYEKYREHAVCNNLRRLSESQVQYCAGTMREKTKEIADLLSDKSAIHFSWTTDDINVREKTGLRAVDAVTDYKNRNITVNRNSFVNMTSSERVFLLTHELFHLTDIKGVPLSDDIEYPQFPGSQGGRQLINAMASSVVVEAYDYGTFQQYGRPLQISQGNKKNWLELDLRTMSASAKEDNAYAASNLVGGGFRYRHQFNEWGFTFNLNSLSQKKGLLTSIDVEEKRTLFGAGITYRWFPFNEPLTAMGQSHLVFTAKIEALNGKITVKDSFIDLADEANSIGPALSATYYLPMGGDLWLQAGAGFSSHNLKYEKISLEYKPQNVLLELGASYAF